MECHSKCRVSRQTRHQHTPAGSVRVIYGLRRSLRPVRGGETTRHVPVSASSAPTACVRMSIHKENPDPRQAARQIAKRVAWISPGRQTWSKNGLAMRKLCRQRTWGPPARPPSRLALRSRPWRAAPSWVRRSSSPTQMPPRSARRASRTSCTSCRHPAMSPDCYRPRCAGPGAQGRRHLARRWLAAARAPDSLFA